MSYDSNIPAPQGAPKLSEIAVDRDQSVIGVASGDTAIVMVEQLRKISVDALMRLNYVLRSDGPLSWDGSNLTFSYAGVPYNLFLDLFQTVGAMPRTTSLQLAGTVSAATSTTFNSIGLASGDLLYLEIDRETLLAKTASPVTVNNWVGFTPASPGIALRTINISTGMGALSSPQVGAGNPTTMFIPLVFRPSSATDIWWIPHGIRWPVGVSSTVGAIITLGLENYPTLFVHSQAELIAAISTVSATNGGMICVGESFTLGQSVTLPPGTILLSRSKGIGSTHSTITFAPTSTIIVSDHCTVKDLNFVGQSGFGNSGTENMLRINGTGGIGRSVVENCSFSFANSSNKAVGVSVASSDNIVSRCHFVDVAHTYWVGISYASGNNNYDVDCEHT